MSDTLDPLNVQFSIDCLQLETPPPLAQHPAAVYLSQLRPRSQRTMRRNLDLIAYLLTQGRCDSLTLDWSKLRYHHTAAVRSPLMEQFAPSTVNQMLCALRRVLKEAKKLKLILQMDYTDAVDIESVRVSKELRGRSRLPKTDCGDYASAQGRCDKRWSQRCSNVGYSSRFGAETL